MNTAFTLSMLPAARTLSTRRGGRKVGATGYDATDTVSLLRSIEEVLPTGANEWEKVLSIYREDHAIPNARPYRDVTSIRNKFKSLLNSKKVE